MDNHIDDKENLTYNILQFVIFITMFGLIIFRCYHIKIQDNSWIWIVNYIGMDIAFINLLIDKCFYLKNKQNKKYKPFVGFTIFMIFVIFILTIPVYIFQSSQYSQFVNDIITLLALFFSLSHVIWNALLNVIVKILKV